MNNELTAVAPTGEGLKKSGMDQAAVKKVTALARAREIAKKLALADEFQYVNIDQVQEVLIKEGVDLSNAAGSIFKTPDFKSTGGFSKSMRVSNHARIVRGWQFVGKVAILLIAFAGSVAAQTPPEWSFSVSGTQQPKELVIIKGDKLYAVLSGSDEEIVKSLLEAIHAREVEIARLRGIIDAAKKTEKKAVEKTNESKK